MNASSLIQLSSDLRSRPPSEVSAHWNVVVADVLSQTKPCFSWEDNEIIMQTNRRGEETKEKEAGPPSERALTGGGGKVFMFKLLYAS